MKRFLRLISIFQKRKTDVTQGQPKRPRSKPPVGGRGHTQELYDLFVEAFRLEPGNASHAARFAGTDHRMAKRVWDEGWVRYDPNWVPIKDFLATERERVRAERVRLQDEERKRREEERERSRKDAIRSQAEEARAAAQARGNAIGLASIIGKLVLGCLPVADRLKRELERPDNLMSVKEMVMLMNRCAYIVREGNIALKVAMEIERLRLGEPTTIIGLKVDDMAPEEMVVHLEAMARTLERAKVLGGDVSLAMEMGVLDHDDEESSGNGFH